MIYNPSPYPSCFVKWSGIVTYLLLQPVFLQMHLHVYPGNYSLKLEFIPDAFIWKDHNFFFIVMQLQLYAFSPHPSTSPQVNPPPSPLSTLPLGFVHVSFIVVPVIPSSHYPRPHPPPPPWL